MARRQKHEPENEDDIEETLISQFETTLTIRPTSNDIDEPEDISIDHTVLNNNTTINYTRDQSIVDIQELEEEELISEQIPKFKTNRRYSLQPKYALKSSSSSSSSSSRLEDSIDTKYQSILKPSILIDHSLTRFTKAFDDFIDSNPHIKSESPRYSHEMDQTLIILSPYSSEHAFGRNWVSKSYLSTIFERPQRLLASCIGVASALTMYPFYYKIINSTKRSSIFSSHVRKIHGKNWPKKLFELCLESHDKLINDQLEVPEDWNTGDIYLNPKTINALEGVIGTIETAVDSLYNDGTINNKKTHNLAFVVIRPPGHHSHACLPSGFCLLNNVQIGIEYAFETYGISHCVILDIDLHHGDGSQDICWERAGFQGDYGQDEDDEINDPKLNPRDDYGKRFATYPKVGYFSLHDIKSYPTELGYATKENIKNASTCIMDHDLNIWNVHLQQWNNEEEFYKHYQTKYVAILNRANQFLNTAKKQYEQDYQQYLNDSTKYNKYLLKPHLFSQPIAKPVAPLPFKPLITISAGFDASEYENPQMQRHGINVPTSFYASFTKDVVKLAKIHTNGKVISFLEGGYSDGALSTGIFSHLIGLVNDDEVTWNDTWGLDQVMKELVKGCKKNWLPYKKPQSDITIWANEVIKLGRAMMPNAILPANYIYQYQSESEIIDNGEGQHEPVNKMVKEIMDYHHPTRVLEVSKSPIKVDPEDERKLMRHTRSYYKKLATAQKQQQVQDEGPKYK
ncbi:histone deacetylase domain-containing protein [Scheffersomyces amazonensis]|uniref:histone deacetylase domain-containing protein n=1 Tax=Scheffersomyces amazonensis TaxID=1078765 RepID=UPI00315D1A11